MHSLNALCKTDVTGVYCICINYVEHHERVQIYSLFLFLCFQGGKGQIRQKKKTVPQKVTIAKIPRAKKKYVTRVCGLATFGQYLFYHLLLILSDLKYFFVHCF